MKKITIFSIVSGLLLISQLNHAADPSLTVTAPAQEINITESITDWNTITDKLIAIDLSEDITIRHHGAKILFGAGASDYETVDTTIHPNNPPSKRILNALLHDALKAKNLFGAIVLIKLGADADRDIVTGHEDLSDDQKNMIDTLLKPRAKGPKVPEGAGK